jgi:hypothetical protein
MRTPLMYVEDLLTDDSLLHESKLGEPLGHIILGLFSHMGTRHFLARETGVFGEGEVGVILEVYIQVLPTSDELSLLQTPVKQP